MKKTKIAFWIITLLFSAFMVFSSIPNILSSQDSIAFLSTHLGFPEYFIPFLGWAKILGIIAILIPGYPIIKEWAYAGLVFELIGATYSMIANDGFQPGILFMALPLVFVTISYLLYHKILKAQAS